MKIIERCRGCRGNVLEKRFSLDPCPIAGISYISKSEARAASLHTLTWVECSACHLVQVLEEITDEELYGSRYHYASSEVHGLGEHFDGLVEVLCDAHEAAGGFVRVLEVGCNDGILLRRLPSSWEAFGVDPSDVASRAAMRASYHFIHGAFPEAVPDGILFDVIVACNCFAHISDLYKVFAGVTRCLKPGGSLWVEVHSLEVLLAEGQWDPIYHEHKAEWSASALKHCAALHQLILEHCETIPAQGGSHRARFSYQPNPAKFDISIHPSSNVEAFARLQELHATRWEAPIARAILEALNKGHRIAAYGASARGSVWLGQHPEIAEQLEYVVDDSPLRQNRFLGGSGLEVVEPKRLRIDPPEVVLITAWNFADRIKASHPWYEGTWLQTFSRVKD